MERRVSSVIQLAKLIKLKNITKQKAKNFLEILPCLEIEVTLHGIIYKKVIKL